MAATPVGGFPAPRRFIHLFFRILTQSSICFCTSSPLTDFLSQKNHFTISIPAVIATSGSALLGLYILLFIITFEGDPPALSPALTSFFLKYHGSRLDCIHMPKNIVITLEALSLADPLVSNFRVSACKRVYVRQDPVVIEKSSSIRDLSSP